MEYLFIILQVIILDGILSIDNMAALAGIASTLPKNQQKRALTYGIVGAYVGRGLMLALAGFLIRNPWIQLAGAGYLIYLVGAYFFNWKKWEPEFLGISNFWKTVVLIELADLAFSIDNVAAVVALSSNVWILIAGVCLSIAIMRFGANQFIKLIQWEPMLESAAYFLILAIAIELILKYFGVHISELVQFIISMTILGVFIFFGQLTKPLNEL